MRQSELLPRGIVPVVQTAFDSAGDVDLRCIARLIDDTLNAGASGFLAPVVASEAAFLSVSERRQILEHIRTHIRGSVPLIVGASSDDAANCRQMGELAETLDAEAWLVAVPQEMYHQPWSLIPFFQEVCRDCRLPLVIQDLQFNGPGLPLSTIRELYERLPTFSGIKIETVPSGPKYTAVREALGPDFWISGGWAVPQMIEALDRGVDAMIPESSMVRVYCRIQQLFAQGSRLQAVHLFRSLLPVLVFSNQDLATSIAFFKRLLVRKGIFETDNMRIPGFEWDRFNLRIADELIDYYLRLESHAGNDKPTD